MENIYTLAYNVYKVNVYKVNGGAFLGSKSYDKLMEISLLEID